MRYALALMRLVRISAPFANTLWTRGKNGRRRSWPLSYEDGRRIALSWAKAQSDAVNEAFDRSRAAIAREVAQM